MRVFTGPCLALILSVSVAQPVSARPHLREVARIDDYLMAVAIADEIRKTCDDIGARMIRAFSVLRSLKAEARALGYSEDEIEDYVTSKAEKKRMRAKATAWLAARGVSAGDNAQLCAFGRREIAKSSRIGGLLR